jgi:hypothetical protein
VISPVVVDARHGTVTAHCVRWDCAVPDDEPPPHLLYEGTSIRDAEEAADTHLKEIRDGQVGAHQPQREEARQAS